MSIVAQYAMVCVLPCFTCLLHRCWALQFTPAPTHTSQTVPCPSTTSPWRGGVWMKLPLQTKAKRRHVNLACEEMERRLCGFGEAEEKLKWGPMQKWALAAFTRGVSGESRLRRASAPAESLLPVSHRDGGPRLWFGGLFSAQRWRAVNQEKHDGQGWGWIWKSWRGLITLSVDEGGVRYCWRSL